MRKHPPPSDWLRSSGRRRRGEGASRAEPFLKPGAFGTPPGALPNGPGAPGLRPRPRCQDRSLRRRMPLPGCRGGGRRPRALVSPARSRREPSAPGLAEASPASIRWWGAVTSARRRAACPRARRQYSIYEYQFAPIYSRPPAAAVNPLALGAANGWPATDREGRLLRRTPTSRAPRGG